MAARYGQSGIVYFTVPGDTDLHFAIRRGRDWWGTNAYRGFRLCGAMNKRAGAALVARDGRRVRVRLVTSPVEVAA